MKRVNREIVQKDARVRRGRRKVVATVYATTSTHVLVVYYENKDGQNCLRHKTWRRNQVVLAKQ